MRSWMLQGAALLGLLGAVACSPPERDFGSGGSGGAGGDATGFTEVAAREGLPAGRFGLREDGTSVHVYFVAFRGQARIGTTEIMLVN